MEILARQLFRCKHIVLPWFPSCTPINANSEPTHLVNVEESYVRNQRIPGDILLIIFEFCLEHESTSQSERFMISTSAPNRWTQVCRFWKDLVVGAPRLWAKIHVRPLTFTKSGSRLLHRHIVYSRHIPLAIHLHLTCAPGWNRNTGLVASNFVRPLLPRCRLLDLQYNCDRGGELLFPGGTKTEMPFLESISGTDWFVTNRNAQLIAPRLQEIHVSSITFEGWCGYSSSPQSLVQRFSLSSLMISVGEVFTLLEHHPHLRSCELTFSKLCDSLNKRPIVLSHLHTLSLRWFQENGDALIKPIVEYLNAPSLHTLTLISSIIFPSSLTLRALVLNPVLARIENLTLVAHDLGAQNLAQDLLAKCPTLRMLSLTNCRGTRAVLDFYASAGERGDKASRIEGLPLHTLLLRTMPVDSEDIDLRHWKMSFMQVVKAGVRGGALRRVELDIREKFTVEEHRQLLEIQGSRPIIGWY